MKWGLLSLAIVTEVIATTALKSSNGLTKMIPTIIVIIGYIISFYSLSISLKTLPIGITYAIWSGVGIVLISLIGWFYFDQHLDIASLIGMFFILVGVVVINVFSKSVMH